MRWEEGQAVVERLLAARELERVSADPNAAKKLIESAQRHLDSARKIRLSDPEGAYAALYDAARKGCSALLEAQGLRATSRGGHVAVRDTVVAQFVSLTGGDALRSFDRLRRRRNDIEYPAQIMFRDTSVTRCRRDATDSDSPLARNPRGVSALMHLHDARPPSQECSGVASTGGRKGERPIG